MSGSLARWTTAVLMLTASAPAAASAVGPDQSALIASKLSVLSIAVATDPEGLNFLNNFIPCARRGVVDYRKTLAGRRATFSGCDLGDGVTVEGSAHLRWRGPGLSRRRSRIRKLKLVGAVAVTVVDSGTAPVQHMTVEGIAFRKSGKPSLGSLVRKSLRVTLFGKRFKVDERGSPRRLFEPKGLDINTIPNPSNTLAALTEADVKRIAYHPALILYALLDEASDAGGVERTNRNPYGSVHIVPNRNGTAHLDYMLRALPIGRGMFIEGSFSQDWTELATPGRLAMAVQGQITLGGGIPRTTLDRVEWGLGGAPKPSQIRISGRLLAGNQERSFAFDLVVND
jgi:hypothetical protein